MSKTPNILLILSDQQRYDCIGRSGKYPVKTPNIDKLASEGIWFDNAYTPIPLCCPARQALLNGRRPESFGGLWNFDNTLDVKALEPTDYSWPRDLKEIGYQTGYVGKWHVNPDYDPTHFGFNDYVSEKDYAAFRRGKYNQPQKKADSIVFFKNSPDTFLLEDARTHWLTRQTIQLIKKYNEEGKPWHIRMDYTDPHLPCHPAEHFADMYLPDEVPQWGSFNDTFENKPYIQRQQLYNWGVEDYTWDDWKQTVALYYGMVSQVDDAIGILMNALKELGLEDDTIVIYTADHGDMGGGHRMVDKHYVMYDDIVRVPLIIRWPGVVTPGLVCNEFISNCLDIAPTILDIVQLEQKDFFHGRSFLSLMKGEKVADWRQEIVSTYNGQQFGLYVQRMIRNNQWKYIWNPTDVDELYNVEEDPYELCNLIHCSEHSDLVAEFRKKLYAELIATGDGMVKSRWMKYQLLNSKKL